jgi:YggT family protein
MTLPGFLANWPFQVPNLLLAMLMYTLAGRLVLGLVLSPDSNNFIMRFFAQLTDPVVKVVRLVTPGMVPLPVLLAFSLVWLFGLRIALVIVFAAAGALPTAPA